MTHEHLSSKKNAFMQHDAAFHLLQITFPLIKDPRLLLGIARNILESYSYAIDSILRHERELNNISPYNNNFQGKMNVFIHKIVPRYNLSPEYFDLILELHDIVESQKKSPIDFSRKNKFVICTKEYNLKSITASQLKVHLTKNKEFLFWMERIITEKNK